MTRENGTRVFSRHNARKSLSCNLLHSPGFLLRRRSCSIFDHLWTRPALACRKSGCRARPMSLQVAILPVGTVEVRTLSDRATRAARPTGAKRTATRRRRRRWKRGSCSYPFQRRCAFDAPGAHHFSPKRPWRGPGGIFFLGFPILRGALPAPLNGLLRRPAPRTFRAAPARPAASAASPSPPGGLPPPGSPRSTLRCRARRRCGSSR